MENSTRETILEVGAEGGSLFLYGSKDTTGQWRFWTQTDESTFADALDKDDIVAPECLVRASASVSSIQDALVLLDQYPWFCLTPLEVHPEFLLAIQEEVRKRGTPEEIMRWNRKCE